MAAEIAQGAGEGAAEDGMAARLAALGLLADVLQRRRALDHALEASGAFKALPVRDRAFTRMLVSTVLRRMGQIDDLIARAAERKDAPRNLALQNILRLGAAQILFMEVPDHAAVDTAVRLAAGQGMERQKAFVNGMLRTIARTGAAMAARQDEGRLNTPEWLLKTWIADYGLRAAAEIAKANLNEAPLDITLKDPSSARYWAGSFGAVELMPGTLRRMAGGAVQEMEGFEDGRWWVQDASAALPARLLGDVRGQSVVDLCAAPGGKTMQLAAAGARVIALDRSAGRLRRLEQNLRRVGLSENVETLCADAATWRPPSSVSPSVPYILLDAPCSATGTMRRHPDVAHLKFPKDVSGLLNAQAAILENAFDMLMPGGVLVYCTCSLQKAEGEGQIEQLLGLRPEARRLPVHAAEAGLYAESLTPEGDMRIMPFHMAAAGGMDGFFIARITKAEAA